MRAFLLSLILLFLAACMSEPRLSGYKYGGGTDNGKIETCHEEDFLNKWWNFSTDNAIANTFVPGYRDLCTLTGQNGIVFWNEVEGWGSYMDYWEWYCVNGDTMKITDTHTGDIYRAQILGWGYDGCYDVKITYGTTITVNGEICPCQDPFEE